MYNVCINLVDLEQETSTCTGHSNSAPHRFGDACDSNIADYTTHNMKKVHVPSVVASYDQSSHHQSSRHQPPYRLPFNDQAD